MRTFSTATDDLTQCEWSARSMRPIRGDVTPIEGLRYQLARITSCWPIRNEAAGAADARLPYLGCMGLQRSLHRLSFALALILNNINKHKLLPTVERYVICNDAWIGKTFMYKFGRPQFSGIFARPKVKDYVLRGGKETITKLRAGRREALLPTLHYLVEVVDRIVNEFLPVLG